MLGFLATLKLLLIGVRNKPPVKIGMVPRYTHRRVPRGISLR